MAPTQNKILYQANLKPLSRLQIGRNKVLKPFSLVFRYLLNLTQIYLTQRNFIFRVFNRNSVARKSAQFLGVFRARNCAQVKSSCVGNPIYIVATRYRLCTEIGNAGTRIQKSAIQYFVVFKHVYRCAPYLYK